MFSVARERGDASCHGFWERRRGNIIFDMQITYTEARSYSKKDFTKILAAQEKGEKMKYLASLHAQRKLFNRVVYTIDGIAGRKAKSAEKRLASFLPEKWKREYSEMVVYVIV